MKGQQQLQDTLQNNLLIDQIALFAKRNVFIANGNNILHQYAPRVDFTCNDHEERGFNFATKSIINVFFNNKEKNAGDLVKKSAVVDFKKRQRLK